MVSVSKITQTHSRYVIKTESRAFSTANGIVRTNKCMPLSFMMGGVDFNAQPYMMTSTPSVLSMGKRVMEDISSFMDPRYGSLCYNPIWCCCALTRH